MSPHPPFIIQQKNQSIGLHFLLRWKTSWFMILTGFEELEAL